MSLVVLLILAVVWAVFLIPQVVRHRAEKTPADSIGAFRSQLAKLEHTTPAPWGRPDRVAPGVVPTTSRSTVVKRRRDVVLTLLTGMGVTLLVGMLPPLRMVLALHLALDLLFVTYLTLLARARTIGVEREVKVRYLPERGMYSPEPGLLLSHSGS